MLKQVTSWLKIVYPLIKTGININHLKSTEFYVVHVDFETAHGKFTI